MLESAPVPVLAAPGCGVAFAALGWFWRCAVVWAERVVVSFFVAVAWTVLAPPGGAITVESRYSLRPSRTVRLMRKALIVVANPAESPAGPVMRAASFVLWK